MSGRAMAEMKRQIVDVVQTFVDVDEEAGVEMSTTQDPGSSGTLYSVSIPVRGVKPQFDVENETYGWEEEPIYESDAWGEEEDVTAKSSAANRVEPEEHALAVPSCIHFPDQVEEPAENQNLEED